MLVAFEGIDGSGKNTQAIKLVERLARERQQTARVGSAPVAFFTFPDYENSDLGPMIRRYLKGDMGKLYANHPLLVAGLYAMERCEKRDAICDALDHGATVICDRYTPSNLAHQGAKFYSQGDPVWLHLVNDIAVIEYTTLGMPPPDLVFYLDLTAEQSQARTSARDNAPDLHQDNLSYLRNTRAVYQFLAGTYQSWQTVACFNADGTARSVDDIHEEIYASFTATFSFRQTKLREDAFYRRIAPTIVRLPNEE